MVPTRLRSWFVFHCVVDLLVAVPLALAPRELLGWLGWQAVDPMAARIVAAALFGIGLESYWGRHGSLESFRGMLRLKVVWSGTSLLGAIWSQVQGGPTAGWAVVGIFVLFHSLWLSYWLRLRSSTAPA
jgi:hypothetical protein